MVKLGFAFITSQTGSCTLLLLVCYSSVNSLLLLIKAAAMVVPTMDLLI